MDLDTNNNKTDFLLPVCIDRVLKPNPCFAKASWQKANQRKREAKDGLLTTREKTFVRTLKIKV